mgnify:CR=1 FL=1
MILERVGKYNVKSRKGKFQIVQNFPKKFFFSTLKKAKHSSEEVHQALNTPFLTAWVSIKILFV